MRRVSGSKVWSCPVVVWCVTGLIVIAGLSTSVTTASATVRVASAVEVGGDDLGDRFVGTGGLLVPGEVDPGTRRQIATCVDCLWRLSWPCVNLVDYGVPIRCLDYLRVCPSGQELLRLFFSENGGRTWRNLGLMCIDSEGPTTVESLGREMRAGFERAVPASGLRHQPARGVLPYLPVIFDSMQPQGIAASTHQLNGLSVTLRPSAQWTWDFGDGASLHTLTSGSRYPDMEVSHTFTRGGTYLVRVTTVWRASFTVDDLGPFPVREPITQESSVRIQVGQARAVLIP